jgi:hypothetical protein
MGFGVPQTFRRNRLAPYVGISIVVLSNYLLLQKSFL